MFGEHLCASARRLLTTRKNNAAPESAGARPEAPARGLRKKRARVDRGSEAKVRGVTPRRRKILPRCAGVQTARRNSRNVAPIAEPTPAVAGEIGNSNMRFAPASSTVGSANDQDEGERVSFGGRGFTLQLWLTHCERLTKGVV